MRPKHDIDRMIPEWYNQHRSAVVWFSLDRQQFVRFEGDLDPAVIG